MAMTKNMNLHSFLKAILASLVAGLFAPAHGQGIDPERAEAIADIAAVRSEVSIGAGFVSEDNRRLGQYSGLRDEGLYGKLDIDFRMLDKADGRWLKFYGRNLGLDNREFQFDHQRQGEWRYFLGFSQTPRYEPYTVNTAVAGIGGTAVTVPASATPGRPVDLSLKRELVSAGFDHAIDKTKSVRLRFTHETKEGARLYGRGTSGAIEFLPEPNDRTTQTFELSLGHIGKDLQLSGGYYGTLFVNHANTLVISGGATPLANPTPSPPNYPFSTMSQPLSNDSHQVFLTGGYNLTPLTRSSFKISETVARQNENFIAVSPNPTLGGAPTTLDGRVDTLLAYFDLSSREFDRLDLQANVRYEDRDDKTPEAQYMTGQPTGTGNAGHTGFNKPRSMRSLKSKLEGGYQLPFGFKGVLSWELDQQELDAPERLRRVAYREELDETTTRVELKRMIAEAATGTVSYSQARRRGSDYITDTYDMNGANAGAPSSSNVNPLLFADRDRDTWRATLDWAPLDDMSLRFSLDHSDDEYSGRTMGPRNGSRQYYALDLSYSLTSRWQATVFLSRDDTKVNQRTLTNPNPIPVTTPIVLWSANLRQLGDAVGVGLRGKLRSGLELGGDLNHYRDQGENRMHAVSAGSAVTSLPDYTYKLTELKLFGSYPIQTNASVRIDYLYHDWKTNDWTWSGWVYSDGTTLAQDTEQRTHLLAASYSYRW